MEVPDHSYLASIFSGVVCTPPDESAIVALLLMLLCLVCSAFLSGTETAFFSLTPAHLEELRESGSYRDQQILDILANPDYFLGTVLLGNNFANTALVMLSEYVVDRTLNFSSAPLAGFIIQVVILTFLLLFFSEVLPKVYFQKNALSMARMASGTTASLMRLLRPFTSVLVRLGTRVARSFREHDREEVTAEELQQAIDLTTEDIEEKGLLKEIVRFYQKSANDVMTPRLDIAGVEYDEPFNEVKRFIQEKGYSRVPVYDDQIDNIKGIIYAKDLIPHLSEPDSFRWQSLIRDAFFVPESKMINSLLEEFRQQKTHMAIVVDEFGGTSGLVTMEDLLEEIFGEIEDEYDEDESLYERHPDGSITLDAKLSLIDFIRLVKLPHLPEVQHYLEEADTVGGMLLEAKGDFPTVGEELKIDTHTFRVLSMGKRRISAVLFIPNPQAHEQASTRPEPETKRNKHKQNQR